MNFTRASFHFATGTLYIHQDGFLSGAAQNLRAMLLDTGAVSAEAFGRGNLGTACEAKDPAGDAGTSFRYTFEGENVRAEERLVKAEEQWGEIYHGPVLDLVNTYGAMLHALGPNPLWPGAVRYATLETLEAEYARAESRRLRHEAGIVALGGRLAAGQAEELRQQVRTAMRAEPLAGRAESVNYEPTLKTFTVIAEIWDNEQGYAATVQAVDDEAAADMVQQQYWQHIASVEAARGEASQGEEKEGNEDGDGGLLRVWAVLEGEPNVIMLRDAD